MLQRLVNRSQFQIRFLQAWGTVAFKKGTMKRKCARFTIWLQNKTKKNSCARWKRLVQPDDEAITKIVKTRLLKAVARWNNQSALIRLVAWRKIAQHHRGLKAKEQRFLFGVRKRLLATGKKTWQDRAILAKRFKRHNLRVVRRLVMALLVRVFEAWYDTAKERARLTNKASKAGHRNAYSALAKFFHGWYECFRKRKHLTSRAIGVVRTCIYRSLARALLHWRSQVMGSRQMYSEAVQGILQMMANATSNAFISWRKHVAEAKRLRAMTTRVAQRFRELLLKRELGCKLRSVLQAWREGVEQVKSKANKAVSVALRRQKCSFMLYFVIWHDSAVAASCDKAQQARKMACVRGVQGIIARLLEAALASAYKRWCDAVEGLGHRTSVAIKRGAVKRRTLLISDRFLAWSECVSIRAQRKENLDRLKALISGLSQHLFSQYLSYAYRKWFDCALYSRANRRKAKLMLEARNKRSASRCIHKWCHHAMLQCRNRIGLGQLLSRMAEHTASLALVQWRQYLAHAAREKRVKANAERLIFRRQKASIHFSWSTWRVSTIEKVVTRCC
jgi:hypothetical protein